AGRSREKDGGGAEAPGEAEPPQAARRGRVRRDGMARGGRWGFGAPNCPPWFLLEGRKREPWAALLRSTVSGNVDLTPNIQPLPPLPAFPGQESLPDPEPPEVFTVGSKTFSWTPFPPALGGSGNSYELFHRTGDSLGSPTPSLKGYPAPDSCQTPSTEECVSVQNPPVLLNCPLCQKAFDPKLAQLDVDRHLAQCLAESTEDVVW
ncbi:Fanconi anemia core complex-associated protein 20, partial [Lemmus lemmus]